MVFSFQKSELDTIGDVNIDQIRSYLTVPEVMKKGHNFWIKVERGRFVVKFDIFSPFWPISAASSPLSHLI
jgi:hypothetical protein